MDQTRPIRVSLTKDELQTQFESIVDFLRDRVSRQPILLCVSGGLDSDVTSRLIARAVGVEQLKCMFVRQDDMDPRHLANAEQLTLDLGVPLVTVNLSGMNRTFMAALHAAEPDGPFDPAGLLLPSRAKCSLRTALLSTYEDLGYTLVGASNRTEHETGFYLPLGDGLAHLQPIVHLYKTQVRQLAREVGTRKEVVEQPASSGFWRGAEDLLDLSFWLFVGAPTRVDRAYLEQELSEVHSIREELTTERVDLALCALGRGLGNDVVAESAGLSIRVASRLRLLTEFARESKHRPFHQQLRKPL